LDQHVVSYVDCPTVASIEAANEIQEKHMKAVEDILG
jgi:hypothetical protein